MAYSKDLRERVIDFVQKNKDLTKQEIGEIYKISVGTIGNWCKKYKETGCVERVIKTDYTVQLKLKFEDIRVYFETHVGATLKSASQHFKVSDVTILNYLKRNGYSYKKKTYVQGKGRRKAA